MRTLTLLASLLFASPFVSATDDKLAFVFELVRHGARAGLM
jgi:hypothetical protein